MTYQNLLLNRGFTEEGQHWNHQTIRAKCCTKKVIALYSGQAQISQTVAISEPGGYRFSVKTETLPGAACRAQLQIEPSGEVHTLYAGGGEKWGIKSLDFNAADNTTTMTIRLEANDGPIDKFGSCFDACSDQ